MRKKDETLRTSLLDAARRIAAESGFGALSIRVLAAEAGVATGTVYNYFASKEDILLALTEEYWRDALTEMLQTVQGDRFPERVEGVYAFLARRLGQGGGKLMASLGGVGREGETRMAAMQQRLWSFLLDSLRGDGQIDQSIWNDDLQPETFTDFVLRQLLALLRDPSADARPFWEVLRRILYPAATKDNTRPPVQNLLDL